MQQDVYPIQGGLSQRRYRVCGLLDMSYGGPIVCFFWMVINMYACVLSFQDRSPIYSYLNHSSLVVQGVVCLFFVISALLSLFSFARNRPRQLRRSHRSTWVFVITFLIVYFVNMVIFGVEKEQFTSWCISKSRIRVVQSIIVYNSTAYTIPGRTDSEIMDYKFLPTIQRTDLYNCTRLWEDEMKFSVVMFVILFTLYIHFAFCFWCHTQDRMITEQLITENMYGQSNFNNNMMMNNNMMNNTSMMMNNNPIMGMNNIRPTGDIPEKKVDYNDDGQRSLAQLARAAFGRLKS